MYFRCKQEKNDGFLPTARHGRKDGGGGSKEGGGNQNDAQRLMERLHVTRTY